MKESETAKAGISLPFGREVFTRYLWSTWGSGEDRPRKNIWRENRRTEYKIRCRSKERRHCFVIPSCEWKGQPQRSKRLWNLGSYDNLTMIWMVLIQGRKWNVRNESFKGPRNRVNAICFALGNNLSPLLIWSLQCDSFVNHKPISKIS